MCIKQVDRTAGIFTTEIIVSVLVLLSSLSKMCIQFTITYAFANEGLALDRNVTDAKSEKSSENFTISQSTGVSQRLCL